MPKISGATMRLSPEQMAQLGMDPASPGGSVKVEGTASMGPGGMLEFASLEVYPQEATPDAEGGMGFAMASAEDDDVG